MRKETLHQKEVLHACADQPLETVLSLISTCPDPLDEREMASVAAENGNAPVLDYFVHNATTSLEPRGCLLLDAARAHSKACVQIMLDQGYDINTHDDRVGNVLNWALGRPRCPEEFIAWLLELGASPNNFDDDIPDQDHCLARAAAHGSIPIMKLLISHGADVNASKALHAAVVCGYFEKVRFLVEEAGANVNEPDGREEDGTSSTPIQRAAEYGRVELAEYLLEKGANMEITAPVRKTLLQAAEMKGNEKVVAALKEREASST